MEIKKFEINGHKYEMMPFSTTVGTPIALKVWALASEPVAGLLANREALAKAGGEKTSVSDLLAELDVQKLGGDLGGLFAALSADPELVRRIFKGPHLTRDGKDLSHDVHYDEAYTGNWKEWLQALFQLVKLNGFLLFFDSLSAN